MGAAAGHGHARLADRAIRLASSNRATCQCLNWVRALHIADFLPNHAGVIVFVDPFCPQYGPASIRHGVCQRRFGQAAGVFVTGKLAPQETRPILSSCR